MTRTVVLILISWAYADQEWAGVPLGIAAAMRLWPGLAIIGLWISGRRKAAYIALAVFIGVNTLGLLLPGVTLEGSLSALIQGGGDWIDHNQNASLAQVLSRFEVPVAVSTLVATAVGVMLAIRKPSQAIGICVVSALIASPLSWPTYMLAALPILVSWWRAGGRLPVAILSSPLLLWIGAPTRWKGHIGISGPHWDARVFRVRQESSRIVRPIDDLAWPPQQGSRLNVRGNHHCSSPRGSGRPSTA